MYLYFCLFLYFCISAVHCSVDDKAVGWREGRCVCSSTPDTHGQYKARGLFFLLFLIVVFIFSHLCIRVFVYFCICSLTPDTGADIRHVVNFCFHF